MLIELKEILDRAAPRLLTDLAGASALVVMLFVGLNLPELF